MRLAVLMRRAKTMTDKGTTLIELMIVLGVVGLTTALGADAFLSVIPRSERQAATAELAVEVRAAHRLAISRRDRIRVVFDPGLQMMRIELVDDPGVVLRGYDYGRRNIASIQLSRGASIIFYPSGRSASPTTIKLVTQRGETSHITVSMTGKVTWS
jgi:type II secretory pathway pseudopilin PulG